MFNVLYNPLADCGNGYDNALVLKKFADDSKYRYFNILDIVDYNSFFSIIKGDIVVAGGDGTLNCFINNFSYPEYEGNIYYYPCGTGNDFYNDIKKGTNKLYDITDYIKNLPSVFVNDIEKKFINGVGYGLDGYCCEVVDNYRKKDKEIDYRRIALKGLLYDFKPREAYINVDGKEYTYKNVWIAPTMKGKFYGGGMMIAPNQDRKNDSLSLVVVHNSTRLKLLSCVPSIYKGEHLKYSDIVTVIEGNEIEVEFNKKCALQIDGETVLDVKKYKVKSLNRKTK